MEELLKQMMAKDKERDGKKAGKPQLSAADKYGLMTSNSLEDDELDPNDPLVKMLDMMLQKEEKQAAKETKEETQDATTRDGEMIEAKEKEEVIDSTIDNKDTEANTTMQAQQNEEPSEQMNQSKAIEEKENIPLNLDIKDVIEAKMDKEMEESKQSESDVIKGEAEEAKEPGKKKRLRTRSDDRHVNQEYQDKKESAFIKGMMKAIGIPDEEFESIAELQK